MISPTLIRIGLGMDPNHRYTERYLEAAARRIERIEKKPHGLNSHSWVTISDDGEVTVHGQGAFDGKQATQGH